MVTGRTSENSDLGFCESHEKAAHCLDSMFTNDHQGHGGESRLLTTPEARPRVSASHPAMSLVLHWKGGLVMGGKEKQGTQKLPPPGTHVASHGVVTQHLQAFIIYPFYRLVKLTLQEAPEAVNDLSSIHPPRAVCSESPALPDSWYCVFPHGSHFMKNVFFSLKKV